MTSLRAAVTSSPAKPTTQPDDSLSNFSVKSKKGRAFRTDLERNHIRVESKGRARRLPRSMSQNNAAEPGYIDLEGYRNIIVGHNR